MNGADPAALAQAYTAAWNSGDPNAVAAFYAPSGAITINGGPIWQDRAGVAAMAAGFFADIPDLNLRCDGTRAAGRTAVYLWTFTGTHVASGKPVDISGWEAWEIGPDGLIAYSRGWFDAEDYARQTA